MNRHRLTMIGSALLVIGIGVWIARNTVWVNVSVPMPPRGEAARNPFYGAQRFAEALGARTFRDRTLQTPQQDAVLVMSGWHWRLSEPRRIALEGWVEAGGRLVVDRSVVNDAAFETWSGVAPRFRSIDDDVADDARPGNRPLIPGTLNRCQAVVQTIGPDGRTSATPITYRLCDAFGWMYLVSEREPTWALTDDRDTLQALRVPVGRGSVTVVNATPFRHRALLDGDHGRIFVAATQLRRGDVLRFISEEAYPSLLALIWQHGAPIVLLTLGAVGLALWRGAARFGPLAPPDTTARRSLAEQIVGTGRFALQRGDGAALHAALVRGLDEAAGRRVAGYARLPGAERAAAIARLTGIDGAALSAALHDPRLRGSERLRDTLAFLELARRRMLVAHTRSSHGTE